MKKKTGLLIVGVIVGVFILFNVCWYITSYSLYNKYIGGMEEFRKNVSYVLSENGYNYNVKFPSYLSFTGNLCVATDDDKYALIIWPSFYKDTEYGVQIIASDGLLYSIMIDKNLNSLEPDYEDLIQENAYIIKTLFEKAKERWDIKN